MNGILFNNILAYLPGRIAIRISMMCCHNNVLYKEEWKEEKGREGKEKEGGKREEGEK